MEDFSFMRFAPSDEELLLVILASKVDLGIRICSMNVKEHNSHFLDPRTVDWSPKMTLFDDERYFLIKRVPKSPSGQKVERTGQTGNWKTAHTKPIKSSDGGLIGTMNHLNFYVNDLETNRSVKTHWIMHEYTLHGDDDSTGFQDWSICRVKDSTKSHIAPVPRPIMSPPSILQSQHDSSQVQPLPVEDSLYSEELERMLLNGASLEQHVEPRPQQLGVQDPAREIVVLDYDNHQEAVDSWPFFNEYVYFEDFDLLPDFESQRQVKMEEDDDLSEHSPSRKRARP